MKTLIVLAVVAVVGTCYWMQKDYEAAMEACQIEHSFDTCFYSLNR